MSQSRTTSRSTMSTGQLVMPASTTPAMLTPPTLSSAAPAFPSPLACTQTLNPDVRRIASATTGGTDLREPASSAPTEHSSISTCSGVSSGTQLTAALPSPSTASTQTPCSTHTCQNPSWTSTETLSHLLWSPMRTPTMRWSTMLHPTMLLPTTPPLSTMLLHTMQPQSTMLLPTMLLLFIMLLPTMQPPSTTPHPSIPWQSPTIPLPSMLLQLPTMQSTMLLLQYTMQLLQSIQLLQSATVSH